MNINSEEYIFKFGCLVQHGVDFMQDFSIFANEFVAKFYEIKPELDVYGYSSSWVVWQKENANNIVELFDELQSQNLIP